MSSFLIVHQGESWRAAFSQTEMKAETIVPFLSLPPPPCKAGRQVPYPRLHQPGSHCLSHLGDSSRPCPTELSGPHKLFPVAFSYKWLDLTHASDFPKFSKTSSIWLSVSPIPLISCTRPGTSSSQTSFITWPLLDTPKPSTNSNHLQITL